MKKLFTFTLMIFIISTFGQKATLDGQKIENEIKIYISKSIKNYQLDLNKQRVIEQSMKAESLSHNMPYIQASLDKAIYAHKELELRKQFFKENPFKTFTCQDLLKANKGVFQLCTDGGFEGGLPTVNPFVFKTGLNLGTLGADIDTSGFVQFFPNVSSVNNFGAYATLVDAGNDPFIASSARVNTGNRAIKLNFAETNSGDVVTMSRNFTVNQNFLDFNYNLILNDPGGNSHTLLQKPFFSVRIYDSLGALLKKVNIVTDPADCSLTSTAANGQFNGTVLSSGWRCARINTADLNASQETVTVEFVISDCALSGHYGTVYIDDICNTNCTNPMFGSINLNYKEGVTCPTVAQTICGTYQLPLNSANQSIVLNVLQNGLIVGSIAAPATLTANTFCFNVPISTFGANPLGNFDYQVVGNFVRTCAINYQLQPLVANSTDYLNPDVMFWPVKAINDNFTVPCEANPSFNILSNDINTNCNFAATASNVAITQITTNPNITLNTATGNIQLLASAAPGTYSIQYQICSSTNTTPCSQYATATLTKSVAVIDAVDDDYTTTPFAPCTAIKLYKFLLNDKLCGSVVNLSDITVSLPTPATIVGATTTANIIYLPNNLAPGTYSFRYIICQNTNPSNCDFATIKIVISPATFVAVNDNFNAIPINNVTGGTTASVLTNDTYNGGSIPSAAGITVSLVAPISLIGATINNAGIVTVPPNTSPGYYTLTYVVKNCLSITTTATVKLFVSTPISVSGTRANDIVNHIEFQSDGKIIISGYFSQYNNQGAWHIARLNTDLSLDTTFSGATTLVGSGTPPYAIKVQSDNKIIVIYIPDFSTYNVKIIRLNANGTLDTTFNAGGSGYSNTNNSGGANCCAIQNDGKIVIGTLTAGNNYDIYNGIPIKNVFRLLPNGTLDSSFNTSFSSPFTTSPNLSQQRAVSKLVIQPDGKILVGGAIEVSSDLTPGKQPSLCRMLSTGVTDTSFTFGKMSQTFVSANGSLISDIEVLAGGSIIVSGDFFSYNGQAKKHIVKLDTFGTPQSFPATPVTTTTNRPIFDLLQEQLSTNFFIGGDFTTYNGAQTNRIIKINGADGDNITTFNSGINMTAFPWGFGNGTNPNFNPTNSFIYEMKQQGDGKIVIVGRFNSYNGIYAGNITRINPNIAGNQSRNSSFNEDEVEININEEKVKVYPNPSKDVFNFDLSETLQDFNTIVVYNLLGEVVFQNELMSKSNNALDLSSLQEGYYIARIANDNSSVQVKIIKK